MKKMYWKNALVLLLLTVSQSVIVGCQDGSKPVSAISDIPPFTDAETENRVVATMGAVNLVNKQVISYLQSMDTKVVTAALNTDGGLEDIVKSLALRANVITRASGQKWQERPEVKIKIEEAQRNILYKLYVNEKAAVPAGYPDNAAVAKFYATSKQQQAAAGKPALEPLNKIAPLIKQQLRKQQQQVNTNNYVNGLVRANPITVDMQKLIGYINMSPALRLQQKDLVNELVARMGELGLSMGLVMRSLINMEPVQMRQLLGNALQLQQHVNRLAVEYFVLNEAIAARFNAIPAVTNHMEQAQLRVVYETFMKAWSAPESGFPGAALIKETYLGNANKLMVPDRYRLALIVIANSGDAEAGERKASQLATAVRAGGADFSSYARQYSQDPQSAKNGGDIGWMNTQAIQPQLSMLLSGNPPGTIVGPVKFDSGWQIIKILGHQPARQQTLEETSPALVAILRNQRSAGKEKQILEQLTASEPITIDKNVLQQLRKQITG